MLLFFLEWISQIFKVPFAFFNVSTRMVLCAITSLAIVWLLGSKVIAFLYNLKTGQSIRVEDCPMLAALHEKKKNTPSMGGLLIVGSIAISSFLWLDFRISFSSLLLFSLFALSAIGAIDDYLKIKHKSSAGLKSIYKFTAQILVGAVICTYLYIPNVSSELQRVGIKPPVAKVEGEAKPLSSYQSIYYLPFKKTPVFYLPLAIGALFTLVVISGTSNAVNLSDGLDGLATGLVMMVAAVFALFAFLSNHSEISRYLHIIHIEGSGEIGVFLMGLFGACLGFLWYNAYPAQVFMGDTGSLSLGGLLGLSAVLLRKEFLLALVGGVLVIEALSVILQVGSYKFRNKKRIFLCTPIHHHFQYKGWTETKVVIRFWIVGLLLALFGLFSIKLQ